MTATEVQIGELREIALALWGAAWEPDLDAVACAAGDPRGFVQLATGYRIAAVAGTAHGEIG